MEDKTEYLNQKLAKRESVLRESNVKSKSTTKTIQVNLSSFCFLTYILGGKMLIMSISMAMVHNLP